MSKLLILLAFLSLPLAIITSCKKSSASSAKEGPKLAITTHWVRANFHAHSAQDEIHDDGEDSPLQLHQAMQKRQIDFSLHSIHSIFNLSKGASEQFQKQREKELHLHVPGITIAVGEELTVEKGPHYRKQHKILGQLAPGNLNHVTLLGVRTFIPNETPLRKACQQVHEDGGICIVNHPGPGPMMWEEGLWEAEKNHRSIDALEVYNGMASSGFGKEFEDRYLEATAYSGLGMHIAAVASADTHGPRCVKNARGRLGKMEIWAERLGQIPSLPKHPRPELDALTLVAANTALESNILDTLRSRKTVAMYGMGNLTLEFPLLGEILKTDRVALQIQFSKPIEKIQLYREGTLIQTWQNTDRAYFEESTKIKAAYVFVAIQGSGRLTTSAVWYEPS